MVRRTSARIALRPSTTARSTRATAAHDADVSELRFVSLQAIRPHEQYSSAHREDLAARLERDNVLRNPIIVAEVRPGAYVLLDGTHRLATLEEHGYSHALVQVVPLADPARVQLSTWAHLASVDADILLRELAASGAGSVIVERDLEDATPSGTDVAWLSFACRPHVVYRLRSHDRIAALHMLLTFYQPERLASDALTCNGSDVFTNAPARNLLVQFRPFAAADICALDAAGERIPNGITRVVITGGRILGTNVPLELLRPEATVTQREAWLASLDAHLPRRLSGPTVVYEPGPRHYVEPVVLFDRSVQAESLSCAAAA